MQLSLLDLAKEIALLRQQKCDGSVNPQGLSGEKIPCSAIEDQIVATALTYADE